MKEAKPRHPIPFLFHYRSFTLALVVYNASVLWLCYAVGTVDDRWVLPGHFPYAYAVFGLLMLALNRRRPSWRLPIVVLSVFLANSLVVALMYLHDFSGSAVFANYFLLTYSAFLFRIKRHTMLFLVGIVAASIGAVLLHGQPSFNGSIFVQGHVILFFLNYWVAAFRINTWQAIKAKSEEAKREKQESDFLLNALSAMVLYKDADNRILKMNKAFADFRGGGDISGRSLYEELPYDMAKAFHDEDLAIIRSGKAKLGTVELFTAGRSVRWVRADKLPLYDEQGQPKGIVIISFDITERMEAEQRAEATQLRFQKLFENSPQAIALQECASGEVICNGAFRQLFRSADEAVLRALFEAQVLALFTSADGDWLRSENYQVESHLQRADGTAFLGQIHLASIHDDAGEPELLIAVVGDISELREKTQRLEAYAEQLEQSNRELEAFAFVISHDLREPLRMIASYVQLLERRHAPALNAEAREFMGYITAATLRMNALINDILEYSRVGRKNTQARPVDLNEMLLEVLHNLQQLVEENKAVVYSVPLPQVLANPTSMLLLLQNLISNALKYHAPQRPPEVRVDYEVDGDTLRLSVADNGIGIEQKHHQLIFEIFQRLHGRDEYSGTGIGLAICKKIVDGMGGRIEVASTPGEGTAFHVLLPSKLLCGPA